MFFWLCNIKKRWLCDNLSYGSVKMLLCGLCNIELKYIIIVCIIGIFLNVNIKYKII